MSLLPLRWREKTLAFLTLFTSTGTLVCCALPATLAAIAGGAAVASLIATFPWLIPLSQHKGWIFLSAGVLLIVQTLLLRRKGAPSACSTENHTACTTANRFSRTLLGISIGIYLVGFFFAYALTPLLRWIEN